MLNNTLPNQYPNMGPASSVRGAYLKWYKPDRLGDQEKIDRMVTDTLHMLDLRGWDMIASRHDSVNGLPVYIYWNVDGSYSIHSDLRRSEN